MNKLSSIALALTLSASGLISVAYASDEYGTGHETVIGRAASSTPAARLTLAQRDALNEEFKVGQNDAFGAARSSQLSPISGNRGARLASTVPMVSGSTDLVGARGQQDELARAIYTPGSGTSW